MIRGRRRRRDLAGQDRELLRGDVVQGGGGLLVAGLSPLLGLQCLEE